ncbi:MAG: GNAT family N-acetyltransferase [Bacteroidetes bacterium]|nr:MAG: GNAT family N-acetyltransferase [Bacteroidota bacterium]
MQIIPAAEKKVFKEFLEFPKDLYKNDPYWIPYSAFDVKNLFDPQKNRFFKHGCCNKWMLVDGSGKAIGRIAAFINSEKLNGAHLSVGGIGFFECINDNDCAHLLFNVAKEWLWQNDMQAMDGPINMGENLNYWGLLVDGFKSPSLGMNYNFPYYEKLFDSYGFIKLYDQYTNLLDATVPMPERFAKIADRVMSNPKYTFTHIDKTHFNQFAKDFQEIYNDAWTDFENFTPIEMDTIVETFRQMKPILDEKIIWYAYCNQEPIACVICLPDVNRILRRLDSHFDWFNKIKFVWYKKTIVIDRLRIILMGCKKKFQNHGIESALIRCLQCEVLPRQKIREVELAWVGDFNNKMMAIHQATGAKKDKVHRTYRYFFDRTSQ